MTLINGNLILSSGNLIPIQNSNYSITGYYRLVNHALEFDIDVSVLTPNLSAHVNVAQLPFNTNISTASPMFFDYGGYEYVQPINLKVSGPYIQCVYGTAGKPYSIHMSLLC